MMFLETECGELVNVARIVYIAARGTLVFAWTPFNELEPFVLYDGTEKGAKKYTSALLRILKEAGAAITQDAIFSTVEKLAE